METIKIYEIKKNKTEFPRERINSALKASEFIRRFYNDDIAIYESFFILLIDRAGYTIGYAKISQGGTVGTVVDKKIVFKYIIDSFASSVILAHNHPSGSLIPSEADKKITRDIKELCKLTDCVFNDHIILTEESYFSFSDNDVE